MLECALQPESQFASAAGKGDGSPEAEIRALAQPPLKPPRSEEEALGSTIGRYKLLQKVGEGGFGVVYVAEQREPVKRRVALKIIKLGMDTRQIVARFEAERQALALMEHPNIAKVFDGGATDAGRPYFVMELVRGPRITDYCDQYQLSTRERLALFGQVCRAIQHAHQKGIIHRDIKPSNVLVMQQDGTALPKVIDFGIAKAIGGLTLTEKTLFTGCERFIGTPAYTSPEQADGMGDIDTRTDIYSLGVLLYELLTGMTPFDSNELLQAGWDRMRRTIRDREAQRPSTRLTSLSREELARISSRRRAQPLKLIHAVRGDLDWIVMKCLEKQRSRRYDTCNSIAGDVERHLNREPVVARPPSNLYKFNKFVRRNLVTVSAGAVVVVAMTFGLSAAAWSYVKGKRAQATIDFFRQSQILRTTLPTNRPPVQVEIPSAPRQPAPFVPVGESEIRPPTPLNTFQARVARLNLSSNQIAAAIRSSQSNMAARQGSQQTSNQLQYAPVPSPISNLDATISTNVTTTSPIVSPGSPELGNTTYPQLVGEWGKWLMELPTTNSDGVTHPIIDSRFFDVREGQDGDLWFLASPFAYVSRNCAIPADKWLFIGLLNDEASTLEDTPFFGRTVQEQATWAGYLADHIVDIFCEIDGVPVPDLLSYRFTSTQITFTAPTPWIFGDQGGTGTSTWDGYFILLRPFGSGLHSIHYRGAFKFNKSEPTGALYEGMDVTYYLTVP
jgi:serine/threonine protein kinase